MKQVLVLLACLAVAIAAPHTRANVNKDIQDLIKLVPKDKIKAIVSTYIDSDEEVKQAYDFALADSTEIQVLAIENSAEFLKVRARLEAVGVDVASLINQVHEIVGYERVTRSNAVRAAAGLRGLLMNEIKPIIPMKKIIASAASKLIFSAPFRKLIGVVRSADFKTDVAAVTNSELATSLGKDARANGVDVEAIQEFVSSLNPLYYDLIMKYEQTSA